MKELKKCEGCNKYMWSIELPETRDNNAERLKYCTECWVSKFSKPMTLEEIEHDNRIPEDDTEYSDAVERYRRFKAN